MKTRILLIAVSALVLVCSTVRAAEYYISPTGDDTASGTISNPWQSPSRGAGLHLDGDLTGNPTVINVLETTGFLASGNLNFRGYGTVAYVSKTDSSFTLAAPLPWDLLPGAPYKATIIEDADILGGDGFEPGDNINFRAGTWTNQVIRLRASGTSLGGPITYKSYDGEGEAFFNVSNGYLAASTSRGIKGVVYGEGNNQWYKIESITIDGLRMKVDQNGMGTSNVINVDGVNNLIVKNTHMVATGSPSSPGAVFQTNKSNSLLIQNSTMLSRHDYAVRNFWNTGLHIEYSVIGGEAGKNGGGIYTRYGTARTTGDHLTIFREAQRSWVDYVDEGGDDPTHWLKNSIIVDALYTSGALYRGGGDYNNVYNNTADYGGYWNDGTGLAGPNDISVDPEFILSGMDKNFSDIFDPDWFRYDVSNANATAGEGGTYLGAFAPVPEPATLALLLISGLSAVLLRRK